MQSILFRQNLRCDRFGFLEGRGYSGLSSLIEGVGQIDLGGCQGGVRGTLIFGEGFFRAQRQAFGHIAIGACQHGRFLVRLYKLVLGEFKDDLFCWRDKRVTCQGRRAKHRSRGGCSRCRGQAFAARGVFCAPIREEGVDVRLPCRISDRLHLGAIALQAIEQVLDSRLVEGDVFRGRFISKKCDDCFLGLFLFCRLQPFVEHVAGCFQGDRLALHGREVICREIVKTEILIGITSRTEGLFRLPAFETSFGSRNVTSEIPLGEKGRRFSRLFHRFGFHSLLLRTLVEPIEAKNGLFLGGCLYCGSLLGDGIRRFSRSRAFLVEEEAVDSAREFFGNSVREGCRLERFGAEEALFLYCRERRSELFSLHGQGELVAVVVGFGLDIHSEQRGFTIERGGSIRNYRSRFVDFRKDRLGSTKDLFLDILGENFLLLIFLVQIPDIRQSRYGLLQSATDASHRRQRRSLQHVIGIDLFVFLADIDTLQRDVFIDGNRFLVSKKLDSRRQFFLDLFLRFISGRRGGDRLAKEVIDVRSHQRRILEPEGHRFTFGLEPHFRIFFDVRQSGCQAGAPTDFLVLVLIGIDRLGDDFGGNGWPNQ